MANQPGIKKRLNLWGCNSPNAAIKNISPAQLLALELAAMIKLPCTQHTLSIYKPY